MLFNSTTFAIFYAIVYSLYWLLRGSYKLQNVLLLIASYVFYGWWDIRFLYLIVMTTAADFCYGLMIGKGFLNRWQRLSVSLLMVFSALFFVTVNWKAVHLSLSGTAVGLNVDWQTIVPSELRGWWVLLVTGAVVVALNVAYPFFETLSEQRRRNWFLFASLFTNLTTLGFFKYYNFFAESFREFMSAVFHVTPAPWTLSIVLPVGISFFTFQSLSYTIDVYKRKMPPENSLHVLLTCLGFFPQLVAGPIERAFLLLPQFHRFRTITFDQCRSGAWLILWGLFQKLVVADNAAVIVNAVFRPFDSGAQSLSAPEDGLRVLIAVYAFALQIFGDFSGYSDIARGTARLMGFELMLNFNLPYFAVNPSDFWRRWHISLSTWLRDYLYIPLGGNRGGVTQTYRNLFLTMLIGGLWHGAAWTYVLWGVYHGVLLIVYQVATTMLARPAKVTSEDATLPVDSLHGGPTITATVIKQCWSVLAGLFMFHLTCLGWLLFRAQNLATVGLFLQSLVFHPHWSPEAARLCINLLSCSWFLILFQVIQWRFDTTEPMSKLPFFVRLNICLFVIMSLLTLSAEGEQTFIYFAF